MKVMKKSKRPFKSGFQINAVKEITVNPHTGKEAYSFLEDDSLVDCRTCVIYEKN